MPLDKSPWKTPFRFMKLAAIFLIGILLVGVYIQTHQLSLDPGQDGLNTRTINNPQIIEGKQSIDKKYSKITDQAFQFRITEFDSFKLLKTEVPNILEHLNSKPLIIFFWATWCKNCKAQVNNLSAFNKRNSEKFNVLSVNIEEKPHQAKIKKYWLSLKSGIPLVIDKERKSVKAFKIDVLPTAALVSPASDYLMKVDGPIDWTGKKFNNKLNKYFKDLKQKGI